MQRGSCGEGAAQEAGGLRDLPVGLRVPPSSPSACDLGGAAPVPSTSHPGLFRGLPWGQRGPLHLPPRPTCSFICKTQANPWAMPGLLCSWFQVPGGMAGGTLLGPWRLSSGPAAELGLGRAHHAARTCSVSPASLPQGDLAFRGPERGRMAAVRPALLVQQGIQALSWLGACGFIPRCTPSTLGLGSRGPSSSLPCSRWVEAAALSSRATCCNRFKLKLALECACSGWGPLPAGSGAPAGLPRRGVAGSGFQRENNPLSLSSGRWWRTHFSQLRSVRRRAGRSLV